MPDRKRPRGSSGVLAALLISPRTFCFYICPGCMRELFYTYEGEDCPHCGAAVGWYVEGTLPAARGRTLDLRAAAQNSRGGGRE